MQLIKSINADAYLGGSEYIGVPGDAPQKPLQAAQATAARAKNASGKKKKDKRGKGIKEKRIKGERLQIAQNHLPQSLFSLPALFSSHSRSTLANLTKARMRAPKAAVPRW